MAGCSTEWELITREDRPARVTVVDDSGKEYDTLGAPDRVVVEESGPLRAVVRLDGHHTTADLISSVGDQDAALLLLYALTAFGLVTFLTDPESAT